MAKESQRPSLTPTKKHLARQERERIQRRYIMIGSALVLVLVVGIILFGFLNESVLKARQPVAVVNGESISTERFQNQTRYGRYTLIQNALNTLQFMQLFGDDPATQSQFVGQLQQIQLQMSPTSVGQQVLDQLVDDALIRQQAEEMGISVTEAEVEQALQEAFGFFPQGTPTPSPTLEPIPTSTLSALQMTLVPPTSTPTATPEITETLEISPTLEVSPTVEVSEPEATEEPAAEESPAETEEPSGPTPTLAPSPTPTEFTEDAYQELKQETFSRLEQEYGINEDTLRYVIESQLYRERVMDAVLEDQGVSRVEEQVWARHILVEDEATAQEVLERLQAGESFADLAAEYSTDTSNATRGGDLQWFSRGQMVAPFEEAAFALEIGEISEPVQTDFGWHIIQVLGKEERPLPEAQYQQAQEIAFSDWLVEVREAAEIETRDYWSDRVPAEPTLPPEVEIAIQQAQQPPLPTPELETLPEEPQQEVPIGPEPATPEPE